MQDIDQILQRVRYGEISDEAGLAEIRQFTGTQGFTAEQSQAELLAAAQRIGLSSALRDSLLDSMQTQADPPGDSPTLVKAAAPVDPDATRLIVSAASVEDDATRVSPASAQPPDGEDATRLVPETPRASESEDDAPTRLLNPTPTSTRATDGSWSHPERWQSVHEGPVGEGSVIKERFVLEQQIGRGGMGSVYRARDLRKEEAQDQETDVAIKLINEEFQSHPDAMVALQREAKKAQALAHPNIVTVYDFDRDGATVYLSMAYLRGEPLDRVISKGGLSGLPAKEAMDITLQMARGLAYAHEKGFAHADFKPGNVFLTEQGDVKILDFGIARAAAKAAGGSGPATGDDTRFDPTSLGAITPAYASAEMLEGQAPETVDDVYALACVAYELVTGTHPFRDAQGRKLPANEAAQQRLRAAPIKQVPKRYQRAIARGLAFARADRYPDAGAFLDALKSPAKTRRSILAGIAVLAVAAGVSWWVTYQQSDIAVNVSDLSPALNDSKALIAEGNTYVKQGDFEEAHKAYAQAWEEGRVNSEVDARERSRLKVVVDRRVDEVIGHYLQMAQRDDLDTFTQEVLRLSLESLQKSELGSRDQEIGTALARLNTKLQEAQ